MADATNLTIPALSEPVGDDANNSVRDRPADIRWDWVQADLASCEIYAAASVGTMK